MSCSGGWGSDDPASIRIAERAGLTKRTVYAYFRSKDDLLAAVLQRYEELAESDSRISATVCRPTVSGWSIRFSSSWVAGQARRRAGRDRGSPGWSSNLRICPAILPVRIARRAKAKTEAWLAERLARARCERAANARERSCC